MRALRENEPRGGYEYFKYILLVILVSKVKCKSKLLLQHTSAVIIWIYIPKISNNLLGFIYPYGSGNHVSKRPTERSDANDIFYFCCVHHIQHTRQLWRLGTIMGKHLFFLGSRAMPQFDG